MRADLLSCSSSKNEVAAFNGNRVVGSPAGGVHLFFGKLKSGRPTIGQVVPSLQIISTSVEALLANHGCTHVRVESKRAYVFFR